MSSKTKPRIPPVVMNSVLEQIGNTPLVKLNKIPQSLGITANVYAKVEQFNAGGSVKDRIALRMIEEAERSGRIKPGDTLIEPTSGNTGIGLALVGAVKGYRVIITLPEKMSAEKVAVLRALGAEIIRTPTQAAFDSPESHISVARRLQQEIPNAHILDQYGNKDNPLAHELGTAEEIWEQTEGKVTCLIAGAGTGGTVTGLARGLRKHSPSVKIVGADPHGSVLALPATLNEQFPNVSYKVEGIGYDFIPDVLDQHGVDKWYKTDDREAFMFARRLISEEGILVGGSSGSAMAALARTCKDFNLGASDTVVILLPDSIRSYLSKFADDDWLAANDLLPSAPVTSKPAPAQDDPNAELFLNRTRSASDVRDIFHGATVKDLRLKPITTVSSDTSCADAIDLMRDRGFDQLPVKTGSKLVGLVTLGNLLSYMASGRASADSPTSEVMFDFGRMSDLVSDPRDLTAERQMGSLSKKRNEFVEITTDTRLDALSRFFEWNSAAVVTERTAPDDKSLTPVGVVTKVDLVSWIVRRGRQEKRTNGTNGH